MCALATTVKVPYVLIREFILVLLPSLAYVSYATAGNNANYREPIEGPNLI